MNEILMNKERQGVVFRARKFALIKIIISYFPVIARTRNQTEFIKSNVHNTTCRYG